MLKKQNKLQTLSKALLIVITISTLQMPYQKSDAYGILLFRDLSYQCLAENCLQPLQKKITSSFMCPLSCMTEVEYRKYQNDW